MQSRARNSLEFWKSTPSTAAALFGVDLPYRPPKSPVGAFFWRRRVWFETTMGLSVLEPWEKVMILVVFFLLLTITATGMYKYLPQELDVIQQRMVYYFFGQEADKGGIHTVQRFVTGLVSNSSGEL